MELQQSLNDVKKEATENERTLLHWRSEHDKLKLEEIESVTVRHRSLSLVIIYVHIAMTRTRMELTILQRPQK